MYSLAGQRTINKVTRLPGQRAGLSRAAVLAAARDLVTEQGLEALTMRALAGRLEVSPNALYSHVSSKTGLIDDLLDDVLAEVKAPVPETADPEAGLYALMASTYDVLLAHPDLVPLYLARQGARGANAQRLGEIMLALLDRAGLRGDRALEARRVLIVYTIGFAAFTTRPVFELEGDQKLAATEMRENFSSGLRWLLAGIAER
jgi:TetR/AcrR family transcriptional regulator, tetracycline repressor protein